ncbi:MAG: ABC transporter transmembrane domain-containing protein [Sphingomonadaceae bacterium]|uniref:ABC transporter transmembrane domain-containing protein n=1 Tax=Thermaurantiacus sp. TaxID=2820283 RepID=UPI00298F3418|nr:ABC transporter transmembrane domain-containing protein [Thermaurantiacus sp.]MCS6986370.1 ABC transporter transmembrane domain-containing protein [Sphingomonadaceae bacterium]MDW8414368.1 ABC transporter transmembrane domain-containing protein [Thermaurantiacus sp.]
MAATSRVTLRDVLAWAAPVIGADRPLFALAVVYGVALSLLSLATPISVQMLINSVAQVGLETPLAVLSLALLGLLLLWALMAAFRDWVMEVFRRRFAARLVAEITVRAVHAENPFFLDNRRADIFNRFFEIMTVHKTVPSLLVGGFSVLLQAGVGLILVAFYHPFFLVFNLLFVLLLLAIWAVFSGGAMRTSVELCHQKYRLAHWLESVGVSDGFYKSARHMDFAYARSERLTADYVEAHRRHFRWKFPQAVALFVLYAVASAALLALGGWLVIREQLSIGQLVAAELILSGVFFGAAQLGNYLEDFYDLTAGLEELNQLYALRREPPDRRAPAHLADATLRLAGVRFSHPTGPVLFDFVVPEGSRLVAQGDPGMERLFAHLLKRHARPEGGLVTLGRVDIMMLDRVRLRTEVIVLDRPHLVETTIEEYLTLANASGDPADITRALRLVGLEDRVATLPEGMQTMLSSTGWPLSLPKTMQLKLAGAILSRPRILVLSPVMDMVSVHRLEDVFRHFAAMGTTLIYFTNRPDDVTLDGFLWLGREQQVILKDRAAFDRLRTSVGKGRRLVVA